MKLGIMVLLFVAGLGSAEQADARVVYVSVGEFGEISFSDVESPGAQAVEVSTSEPSSEQLQEAERETTATLALADDLAAARRARAQERAAHRATVAAPAPPVAAEPPRDVYYPALGVPWHRRHPQNPRPQDPDPGEAPPPPVEEQPMKWLGGSQDR